MVPGVSARWCDETTIARVTFPPGFRWSDEARPVVGTDWCQHHHLGVSTSGQLHVVTEEGLELDILAGAAYEIPPGHDAWVVGAQPFEVFQQVIDMELAGKIPK